MYPETTKWIIQATHLFVHCIMTQTCVTNKTKVNAVFFPPKSIFNVKVVIASPNKNNWVLNYFQVFFSRSPTTFINQFQTLFRYTCLVFSEICHSKVINRVVPVSVWNVALNTQLYQIVCKAKLRHNRCHPFRAFIIRHSLFVVLCSAPLLFVWLRWRLC